MKKLMMIVSIMALVAGAATAEVLWDQSTPDPSIGAVNDSQSGCAPTGNTTFLASDVTFTEAVTIQSVSTWYTADDPDFVTYVSEAYLFIAPKTANTPITGTDIPLDATLVPVTVTTSGIAREVNAAGLDITLEAGDYWVGLTPVALTPLGLTDQHWVATTFEGDSSSLWLYCQQSSNETWFSLLDLFGIAVDVTLKIEGESGVVATEAQTLSELKANFR